MNGIVNEIEIQEREKPAAGEIFYNICHSRTQIINEILKKIEILYRSDERPLQAKFFNSICRSRRPIQIFN